MAKPSFSVAQNSDGTLTSTSAVRPSQEILDEFLPAAIRIYALWSGNAGHGDPGWTPWVASPVRRLRQRATLRARVTR